MNALISFILSLLSLFDSFGLSYLPDTLSLDAPNMVLTDSFNSDDDDGFEVL